MGGSRESGVELTFRTVALAAWQLLGEGACKGQQFWRDWLSDAQGVLGDWHGGWGVAIFPQEDGLERAWKWLRHLRRWSEREKFRGCLELGSVGEDEEGQFFLGKLHRLLHQALENTLWGKIAFLEDAKRKLEEKYHFRKKDSSYYLLSPKVSTATEKGGLTFHPAQLHQILREVEQVRPEQTLWLHLVGEPGIGKSRFLRLLYKLFYNIHEGIALISVLPGEPEGLLQGFRNKWPGVQPALSLDNFRHIWREELWALFIDDWERVESLERKELEELVASDPKGVVVTASKEFPKKPLGAVFELRPLQDSQLIAYWHLKVVKEGFPKNLSHSLARWAMGNPKLAREWWKVGKNSFPAVPQKGPSFLGELLTFRWRQLSSVTRRKALKGAAIFDEPFASDFFEQVFPNLALELPTLLREKWLCELEGKLSLPHPAVRQYILENMSEKTRRELLLQVVEVLRQREENSPRLWRHLLALGERTTVLKLVEQALVDAQKHELKGFWLLEEARRILAPLSEVEMGWWESLQKHLGL